MSRKTKRKRGGRWSEIYADDLSDIPSDYESDSDMSKSDESSDDDVPLKVRKVEPEDPQEPSLDMSIVKEENVEEPTVFVDESNYMSRPDNVDNCSTIEELLNFFINDEIFQLLSLETNRYQAQCAGNQAPKNHQSKWDPVTIKEMKHFFGLLILMGIVRKDQIGDYWSTNALIETPIFPKVMSRSRFLKILSYLHFENNQAASQDTPRLFKVQRVFEHFSKSFETLMKPGADLSLEESLIPWRGKFAYRLNNITKDLSKYGITVKLLCDQANGSICHLNLFAGGESCNTEIKLDYNNYKKGATNLSEQYLAFHSIFRKTQKWHKKIIFFLFSCATYNIFKVFLSKGPKERWDYKKVLLSIVEIWLSGNVECLEVSVDPMMDYPETKGRVYKDHPARLNGDIKSHVLQKIVSGKTNKPLSRACRVCSYNNKRRETRYMCQFCKVPLHFGKCFEDYHTKLQY